MKHTTRRPTIELVKVKANCSLLCCLVSCCISPLKPMQVVFIQRNATPQSRLLCTLHRYKCMPPNNNNDQLSGHHLSLSNFFAYLRRDRNCEQAIVCLRWSVQNNFQSRNCNDQLLLLFLWQKDRICNIGTQRLLAINRRRRVGVARSTRIRKCNAGIAGRSWTTTT